jgi:2-oxoglutarate ferredoxin oxidoreductase subunit alpha
MQNRLTVKISGPAGTGIMQAGATLSRALNRLGFYTLVYPEYPSRIRGGDNHIQVVFSPQKHFAPEEKIDLLLALGRANFEAHKTEGSKDFLGFEGGQIGLNEIAKELGNPLVVNTAGLGFLWGVMDFELKALEDQLAEDFKEKKEVRELNVKAAQMGYRLGQDQDRRGRERKIKAINQKIRGGKAGREKIANLTGNEALTEGILASGCRFAAIYPMTPINEILRLLAKTEVKVFRPEDEIAGIMAAIGASFAGDRAMVATSGGGFSLMVEGLGLAGIAEIPLVIVLGQRTGPSSGMATYSSQADLNFAINAGHGEFPRIVLAPGDLRESFRLGAEAFNLAERYQVPVILLTDKYLAESRLTESQKELKIKLRIDRGKKYQGMGREDYERYELTPDGVSPQAVPGQVTFLTNSYEHDEHGFSTDDPKVRDLMMQKRAKKLKSLTGGVEYYGPKGAKTILTGWGSTKEIILDTLREFPDDGFLHFWRPWPFPQEAREILRGAKRIIAIEGNFSGQLADLIEQEIDLPAGRAAVKVERVLKDNGRPFYRQELIGLIGKFKR